MTRIDLTNQQLYFLHIPKTGGTTLMAILDGYFLPSEIFPAALIEDLIVMPDLLTRLRQARLVRGHFWHIPHSLQSIPPITITLIRQPLEQMLSHYDFIRRTPKHPLYLDLRHLSFEEVLNNPKYVHFFMINHQTSELAVDYHVMRASHTPIPPNPLEVALRRLDQMALVGVTDRFDDFIRLMCQTFGWELPAKIPRVNVAPQRLQVSDLSPATLERLIALNQLDFELYAYANRRFDQLLADSQRNEVALPFEVSPSQEQKPTMPNERVIEIPWMLAQLPQTGVVLDVGSCEATYLSAIPQSDRFLHCLDPRPCLAEIPAGAVFHGQNLIGNTLPRHSYTAVILLSTLEHIGLPYYDQAPFPDGDALALAEVRDLLQPQGYAVITLPVGQSRVFSWFRQYSPADLGRLFAHWETDIHYWGFDGQSYQPIAAETVENYDYRFGKGAGALAAIIARYSS